MLDAERIGLRRLRGWRGASGPGRKVRDGNQDHA
jgi:hypothetical protein